MGSVPWRRLPTTPLRGSSLELYAISYSKWFWAFKGRKKKKVFSLAINDSRYERIHLISLGCFWGPLCWVALFLLLGLLLLWMKKSFLKRSKTGKSKLFKSLFVAIFANPLLQKFDCPKPIVLLLFTRCLLSLPTEMQRHQPSRSCGAWSCFR